jgi:hypothetical protein
MCYRSHLHDMTFHTLILEAVSRGDRELLARRGPGQESSRPEVLNDISRIRGECAGGDVPEVGVLGTGITRGLERRRGVQDRVVGALSACVSVPRLVEERQCDALTLTLGPTRDGKSVVTRMIMAGRQKPFST